MFLVELLLEGVVQLVLELILEIGFTPLAKAMESRLGRLVVSSLAGLAGGWAWGWYLRSNGHDGLPKTVWVSLAIAAGAALAATALRSAAEDPETAYPGGLLPWRWTPHQWDALALLNVFVALGVVLGFA